MTTRLISTAIAAVAFALLIAGNAWAQDFDPCAGLTGKAKGLCTAYTKGMGCSSDSADATEGACANVATMFEEVTGSPPPSDCPCDYSLERIKDSAEGWDLTASFSCREFRSYDPPNLRGENVIDLFDTSGNDAIFIQINIPFFDEIASICTYKASGVELERVNSFTGPV